MLEPSEPTLFVRLPRKPASPTSRSHTSLRSTTDHFTLFWASITSLLLWYCSSIIIHHARRKSPLKENPSACKSLPINPTRLVRLTKSDLLGQAHCQDYNRAASHVSSTIFPSLLTTFPFLSSFALSFVIRSYWMGTAAIVINPLELRVFHCANGILRSFC